MKAATHDPRRAALNEPTEVVDLRGQAAGIEPDAAKPTRSENPQGRLERRSGTVDGVAAIDNAA